jgi:beta-phosphoglucomutase-like phosphatase (HAD superfamily)
VTPPTAILDIDGTLVDTNYHHAIAWYRAFRQHGVVLPVWRIHRHIGMGGDQLVGALAGEEVEKEHGDDIRTAEKALYFALIEEVEPMHGARELLVDLKDRGHTIVLASSAKAEEVDHYLDLLEARDVSPTITASPPSVPVCRRWRCSPAASPSRSCATLVRRWCSNRSTSCAGVSTTRRWRPES